MLTSLVANAQDRIRSLLGRGEGASAMTPEEVAAACRSIGGSQAEIAASLQVTIRELEAWAAGTRPVSRRAAAELRWDAAVHERRRTITAAGLPECASRAEMEKVTLPESSKEREAFLARVKHHAETCGTCAARERYAKEHLPPLPRLPTLGLGFNLLIGYLQRVEALPVWARPAVHTSAACLAWVGLPAVLNLFRPQHRAESVPMLLAPVGGAYVGLVGGFLYRWAKARAGRGAVPAYLAGVGLVAGLAVSVALPVALFAFGLQDLAPSFVLASASTLLLGPVAGHLLCREEAERRRLDAMDPPQLLTTSG